MAAKEKPEQGKESKGLLAKIKGMFGRGKVPEKTEMLIAGVESVDELRRALDTEVTENEVYAGQIERELEKLGLQVDEQKDLIKTDGINERAKINALRAVKRLQERLRSYERRLKILQDNIDIHLTVLNQIDEMEAMEMKAVRQQQIEEIALEHEERLEKHRDFVNVVRSAISDPDYEDVLEKKELADLEKQIMAEKEAEEEAERSRLQAEQERLALERQALEQAEALAKQEREQAEAAQREAQKVVAERPPLDELLRQEVSEESPKKEKPREIIERQLELE